MVLVPLLLMTALLETPQTESQAPRQPPARETATEGSGVKIEVKVLSVRLAGTPSGTPGALQAGPGRVQLTNPANGTTCTMLILQVPDIDPGIEAPLPLLTRDRMVDNSVSPCVE